MSRLDLVEQLAALSAEYDPSDDVKDVLRQRELIPLIGPFAVGKTTLMYASEELDGDFGRVRSFTTRTQRVGEGDEVYDFLPHNDNTLRGIRERVTARELVQFAVHPTTGNVYGSTTESYRTTYFMLDAVPSALPGLVPLPFRKITKVAVTAPPDVWEGRVAERLRISDADDVRKRISEGVMNLAWSLDQGDDLLWVVNGDRPIHDTAHEFIGIARGSQEPDRSSRLVADSLLTRMIELQDA